MASQLAFFSLAFLSSIANAVPLSTRAGGVGFGGDLPASSQFDYPLDKRDTKLFPLRVLPLGASITFGYASVDKNGYRKALRDQLRFDGWQVDMVGGVQSGTFVDNDNEGHPGDRLDQVSTIAETAVQYQPNVITINVGTNDAVQNKTEFPVETYHERMDKMLDMIYQKIPGVTVLLSTVLQNANANTDKNARVINPQIRTIIENRRKANQRIVLAEMYGSNPWITKSDLIDGTHPTAVGYQRMASIWWAAFQEADSKGFLQPPNKSTRKITCDKEMTGSADTTQVSTPTDFFQAVQPQQNAQIVAGGSEETVWRIDGQAIYVYKNNNGQLTDGAALDIQTNCWAKDVRWFDVNNDGLADFVCLGVNQETYVQLNQGGSDYPPKFKDVGKCLIPRTGDDGAIVDPKLPAIPTGKT